MRGAIIFIFFIFYFLFGVAASEGKKRKSHDPKSDNNIAPSKTEIIKTVRKDVSSGINKRTQMHKLGATWWQIKRSEDKLMDEDIPSHSKLAKDSRDDEKNWF